MDFNILIVEDNYTFAIELEMHLEQWGCQVIGICDRGNQALEMIEQESPNLILMDINIIGSPNGVEVASQIKHLNIPIIYMTGLKDQGTYEEAKKTTGIQYLVKPFNMLTLKATMEYYFQQQSNSVQAKDLFVRKNTKLIRVDPSKIDWIESSRNYSYISTEGTKFIIRQSLKETIAMLPKTAFVKVHRSYVVRLKAVTGILLSKNTIMVGEQTLPLGRTYRKNFLERIKQIS